MKTPHPNSQGGVLSVANFPSTTSIRLDSYKSETSVGSVPAL